MRRDSARISLKVISILSVRLGLDFDGAMHIFTCIAATAMLGF